jgi:anti-sigma B factor antagonist
MTITETLNGSITIVAINGTLDAASAPELLMSPAINSASKTIVIDLENADFLDSSGLGALVATSRKKRQMNALTILCCMSPRIRRVFEITNAYRLFPIFDERDAAVEYASNQTSRT